MAALADTAAISEADDEDQADELEALTSIYPEKIVLINEGGEKHRCFELSVSIAPVKKTVPVYYVPLIAAAKTPADVKSKSHCQQAAADMQIFW